MYLQSERNGLAAPFTFIIMMTTLAASSTVWRSPCWVSASEDADSSSSTLKVLLMEGAIAEEQLLADWQSRANTTLEITSRQTLYDDTVLDVTQEKINDCYMIGFSPFQFAHDDQIAELTSHIGEERFHWHELPVKMRELVTFNKKVMAVPVDANPVTLLYRKDIIAATSTPNSWEDLIELAKQNNGTDLNGDGEPDFGLCMVTDRRFYMTAYTIAATVFRTGVSVREGYLWDVNQDDTQPMTSLLQSKGWEYVFNISKELFQYTLQQENHPGQVRALWASGRCAVAVMMPSLAEAGAQEDAFVFEKVATARTPGATKVFDRSNEQQDLVPCDPYTCPQEEFPNVNRPSYMESIISMIIRKNTSKTEKCLDFAAYFSTNIDVRKPSSFQPFRQRHWNVSWWLEGNISYDGQNDGGNITWGREEATTYTSTVFQALSSSLSAIPYQIPGDVIINRLMDKALKKYVRMPGTMYENSTANLSHILKELDEMIVSKTADQGISMDMIESFIREELGLPARIIVSTEDAEDHGHQGEEGTGSRATITWLVALVAFLVILLVLIVFFFCYRYGGLIQILSGTTTNASDINHAPLDTRDGVAVLLTEISASSLLWSHCPGEMAHAADVYYKTVRKLTSKHSCYEVRCVGECLMIVSSSCDTLLQLSMEIQETMHKQNQHRKKKSSTSEIDRVYQNIDRRISTAVQENLDQMMLHTYSGYRASTFEEDDIQSHNNPNFVVGVANSTGSKAVSGSMYSSDGGGSGNGSDARSAELRGRVSSSPANRREAGGASADIDSSTSSLRGLRVKCALHFDRAETVYNSKHDVVDYEGPLLGNATRIEAVGFGGQILMSRSFLAEIEQRDLAANIGFSGVGQCITSNSGASSTLSAAAVGAPRTKAGVECIELVQLDNFLGRRFPPQVVAPIYSSFYCLEESVETKLTQQQRHQNKRHSTTQEADRSMANSEKDLLGASAHNKSGSSVVQVGFSGGGSAGREDHFPLEFPALGPAGSDVFQPGGSAHNNTNNANNSNISSNAAGEASSRSKVKKEKQDPVTAAALEISQLYMRRNRETQSTLLSIVDVLHLLFSAADAVDKKERQRILTRLCFSWRVQETRLPTAEGNELLEDKLKVWALAERLTRVLEARDIQNNNSFARTRNGVEDDCAGDSDGAPLILRQIPLHPPLKQQQQQHLKQQQLLVGGGISAPNSAQRSLTSGEFTPSDKSFSSFAALPLATAETTAENDSSTAAAAAAALRTGILGAAMPSARQCEGAEEELVSEHGQRQKTDGEDGEGVLSPLAPPSTHHQQRGEPSTTGGSAPLHRSEKSNRKTNKRNKKEAAIKTTVVENGSKGSSDFTSF